MMNNQRFDEAESFAAKIEKDIDLLAANLRDLPTYISIVRKYIPKRLEELYAIIEDMKEKDFSIEKLNASVRYNKIHAIKDLRLENVGSSIEVMTDELNGLGADLEKEQAACNQYEEARNNCYRHIGRLDDGLKRTVSSLAELQRNYLLSDYNITISKTLSAI